MAIFDRFRQSQPSETSRTGADAESTEAQESFAQESADAPLSAKPAPTGLFSRLRQGLQKTTQILNTDVRDLFKKEGQLLDDDLLDRLFAMLIRTDMGTGPAREIREDVEQQFRGRVIHIDDVLARVKVKLKELTAQPAQPITFRSDGPTVIMVVGVNGSGKTTSIAKLAASCITNGQSVVLGAADTFRAAAVEQLTIWAERIGAEIVKGEQGSDPASVAHRALAKALESKADVCIVDTAGRLQTQINLMEQLAKIRRVMAKLVPDAPHEVLLVLDATAGQNGISQAKGFSDAVECTGIVLAKLDGTAKGGVIIPIRQQFDLPVKFIGVGEQLDDLATFDSQQFVDALFAGLAS